MVHMHRRRDLGVFLALLDHPVRGDAGIQLGRNLDQPVPPKGVTERDVTTQIPAVLRELQLAQGSVLFERAVRQEARMDVLGCRFSWWAKVILIASLRDGEPDT